MLSRGAVSDNLGAARESQKLPLCTGRAHFLPDWGGAGLLRGRRHPVVLSVGTCHFYLLSPGLSLPSPLLLSSLQGHILAVTTSSGVVFHAKSLKPPVSSPSWLSCKISVAMKISGHPRKEGRAGRAVQLPWHLKACLLHAPLPPCGGPLRLCQSLSRRLAWPPRQSQPLPQQTVSFKRSQSGYCSTPTVLSP